MKSIGVVRIIDGLYCLKSNYTNYKDIYSYCNNMPIFDDKYNIMGYLDVEEIAHVFNNNYNFGYYFISIYNPTKRCIQDALAYPLI